MNTPKNPITASKSVISEKPGGGMLLILLGTVTSKPMMVRINTRMTNTTRATNMARRINTTTITRKTNTITITRNTVPTIPTAKLITTVRNVIMVQLT